MLNFPPQAIVDMDIRALTDLHQIAKARSKVWLLENNSLKEFCKVIIRFTERYTTQERHIFLKIDEQFKIKCWEDDLSKVNEEDKKIFREIYTHVLSYFCYGDHYVNERFTRFFDKIFSGEWKVPKPYQKEKAANDKKKEEIKAIEAIETKGEMIMEMLQYGCTDEKISKLFVLLNKDTIIFDEINESWYIINKFNIWKKNKKGHRIMTIISRMKNPIQEIFFKVEKTCEKHLRDTILKNYGKIIGYIESTKGTKNIMEKIRGELSSYDLFEKFDNINGFLFAFNNGVYDLKEKKFRLPEPQEYITVTCGYDYQEKNEEIELIMKDIEKIISSMMETEQDKKCVLMELAQCLIAIPMKEQFYVWKGLGRNGKGVLRDFVKNTFGPDYFDVMDIDYLNKSKHGQSVNAADEILAKKKNCRIVMATEPESDVELKMGKIKAWSGGDPIQTRFNYGSAFNFVPKFKLFIQSNFDIIIKSANSAAVGMRLSITDFPYCFVNNPILPTEKKIDETLKYRIQGEKYKIAFFYILLDLFNEWEKNDRKIDYTKKYEEYKEIYLAGNDLITPFITELLIKSTDEKAYTKSSELYMTFKQFYAGETKTLNISEFRSALENKGIKLSTLHGYSIYRGIIIDKIKLKSILDEKNKINDEMNNLEIIDV